MAKAYVKFEVPKEIVDRTIQALEVAKNTGKIRKGTNEVTKTIERGKAKLVVIAGDVEPPEIVMHLPIICNEKKVAYTYIPSKRELGRAVGIDVGTASVAIVDPGEAKGTVDEIIKKLENVQKKG